MKDAFSYPFGKLNIFMSVLKQGWVSYILVLYWYHIIHIGIIGMGTYLYYFSQLFQNTFTDEKYVLHRYN